LKPVGADIYIGNVSWIYTRQYYRLLYGKAPAV